MAQLPLDFDEEVGWVTLPVYMVVAGWHVQVSVHVVPIGDTHQHIACPSCHCRPGFDGNCWVHDSVDGREAFEGLGRAGRH